MRVLTVLAALALPLSLAAHPVPEEQEALLTAEILAHPGDPGNAGRFLLRGDLERRHRDWARAEADFDRAERISPLAALVLCRARLDLDRGRPGRALDRLRPYLKAHPSDVQALSLQAAAWGKAGKPAQAGLSFERAFASGGDVEHCVLGAQAFEKAGLNADARRLLDAGLKAMGSLPVLVEMKARLGKA